MEPPKHFEASGTSLSQAPPSRMVSSPRQRRVRLDFLVSGTEASSDVKAHLSPSQTISHELLSTTLSLPIERSSYGSGSTNEAVGRVQALQAREITSPG
jgi:hypothetical protein